MTLFQEDYNNQIIDDSLIVDRIIEHFSKYDRWMSITEAQADFFVKYGAICKSGDIAKILKKLEKDNRLEIKRNPSHTEKGKITKFMSEGQGQTVEVKWVK